MRLSTKSAATIEQIKGVTQLHAADWGGVAQLLDKKRNDAHNDAHAQEASDLLVFYTV